MRESRREVIADHVMLAISRSALTELRQVSLGVVETHCCDNWSRLCHPSIVSEFGQIDQYQFKRC